MRYTTIIWHNIIYRVLLSPAPDGRAAALRRCKHARV